MKEILFIAIVVGCLSAQNSTATAQPDKSTCDVQIVKLSGQKTLDSGENKDASKPNLRGRLLADDQPIVLEQVTENDQVIVEPFPKLKTPSLQEALTKITEFEKQAEAQDALLERKTAIVKQTAPLQQSETDKLTEDSKTDAKPATPDAQQPPKTEQASAPAEEFQYEVKVNCQFEFGGAKEPVEKTFKCKSTATEFRFAYKSKDEVEKEQKFVLADVVKDGAFSKKDETYTFKQTTDKMTSADDTETCTFWVNSAGLAALFSFVIGLLF